MPEVNYIKIYGGDFYDPEEHIHDVGTPVLEERWFLEKSDDKFGWYLNHPVYKKDTINNGDYAHNTILNTYDYINEEGQSHTIEYMYTLFDENYHKLKTPLKDPDDGNIEIKHGLLDWMKKDGE